jgi:DnaJ-class molecular chaperone
LAGTNAVGTYTDTTSGNFYGYLYNGSNYTTIFGPEGTNGSGILTIDAVSGSSIAGTYSDANGVIKAFVTTNGVSYTPVPLPPGSDPYVGISTVDGVSGTTVVGTYYDTTGNLFGFQGSAKVTGPVGLVESASTLLTINGINGSSIIGTYTDPNTSYTYGFSGSSKIMGPLGTNGVGISTIDIVSGGSVAGTYTDTNINDPNNPGTGLTYGFVTTDAGKNYTVITGPDETLGINLIKGVSGNLVIGQCADADGNVQFFAYDGTAYAIIDVPSSQPNSTIVNGVSGNTIFGSYTDAYGLSHGFTAYTRGDQSITFNYFPSSPGVFNLNATASSGLSVSYVRSGDTQSATLSGSTLTFTKPGTVSVTASQAGNADFSPADNVTNTFTMLAQEILTNDFATPNLTFGANTTISNPPTSSAGLPVTLSVSGDAVLQGNTIRPLKAGTAVLYANQAGTATYNPTNYFPATQVAFPLVIGKAAQTIGAFQPIPNKYYGGPQFSVVPPTSSAGLPVTLAVSNASISGNIITLTKTGTVTLTADQAGNDNYLAATPAVTTFTVLPGIQTVTAFSSIGTQTFSANGFTIVPPTSSASSPVTIHVVNGTYNNGIVYPSSAGVVTLQAIAEASENYGPASNSPVSVFVNKAQSFLSAFAPIANITGTTATVEVTPPTSQNTNVPVVVSVVSGPASYDSNSKTVNVTAAGIVTLQATQAGDANYLSASPVSTSFSVGRSNQAFNGTFGPFTNRPFSTIPFAVSLPSSDSQLPVALSVVSGPAVAAGTNVTLTGTGQVILAAIQSGNTQYGPIQTNTTFTVTQGANEISDFAAIGDRKFGDTPFSIPVPTASSGLPVTLSVLSGPASLSGNAVTLSGAGIVTLAADQPGNANFPAAARKTTSFTVFKATQTIASFAPISNKTYGAPPFAITTPSSSSALPVGLAVSGPAYLAGNLLNITNTGTVTVTASQPGDANYQAATPVTVSFSVSKASQTIAPFASIPAQTYGIPFQVTAPVSDAGLPVQLSVLAGGSISNNTVTPNGAGVLTIAASQPGDASYAPATAVTTTVTVKQATQVLSQFPPIDNIDSSWNTVAPFKITPPTSTSPNPVILSVKGPARIDSNNVLTLTGDGLITVTATQPADANYLSAAAVSTSFSVGRTAQILSGPLDQIPDKTFGNLPFTVTLPTADSGQPVSLTVLSGPATVKGNTVTLTGAGMVTLAATQPGNTKYAPVSTAPISFGVDKKGQTINAFGTISNVQAGSNPFKVKIPTSDSGLPVTLSVFSGPATVQGDTVTVTGVGPVILAANQPGNDNFSPATQVTSQTFNVTKASQVVTFKAIPSSAFAAQSMDLSATASSGLMVTQFESSDQNVAVINGNRLTVTGVGTAIITAIQAGNDFYSSNSASQSLVVTKGSQTINSFQAIPSQPFSSGLKVPLTAPASSSGLPVTLTASPVGTASLDGNNILSVIGAGKITLTASQPGNASYTAAKSVTTTMDITKAQQVLQPFVAIENITTSYTSTPTLQVVPPTSSSPNPVILSVKGPATIDTNNLITFTGDGTVTVTANQSGDANYLSAAAVSTSFSVGRQNQTLSNLDPIPDQIYSVGGSVKVPLPTATPSGAKSTLSVISGPATVKGSALTLTGAGAVTVAASVPGDKTYGPAATAPVSFMVSKATQNISPFEPIQTKTYGTKPFKVKVPTSNSKLPVVLSVLSGPATVSGDTVTVIGAGDVTLAANQLGNGNYTPASQVTTTFLVQKAVQTISFKLPAAQTFGNNPFPLTATVSSGLPIRYVSSNTDVASVSGSVVTIVGAGSSMITAYQDGNDLYNSTQLSLPAPGLTVKKAAQNIQVVSPSAVTFKAGMQIQLTATSSSGTPVTFARKSGNATVTTDGLLTPSGKGAVSITASSAESANYASSSATVTIQVK